MDRLLGFWVALVATVGFGGAVFVLIYAGLVALLLAAIAITTVRRTLRAIRRHRVRRFLRALERARVGERRPRLWTVHRRAYREHRRGRAA